MCKPTFSHGGDQFAAVTSPGGGAPRQARIFDLATHQALATLSLDDVPSLAPLVGTPGSSRRSPGSGGACYSPSDELLLWGNVLWDPRTPAPVHRFDAFTDPGNSAGAFHPNGLEVILNSEIW